MELWKSPLEKMVILCLFSLDLWTCATRRQVSEATVRTVGLEHFTA
jgi:hypothetical protein